MRLAHFVCWLCVRVCGFSYCSKRTLSLSLLLPLSHSLYFSLLLSMSLSLALYSIDSLLFYFIARWCELPIVFGVDGVVVVSEFVAVAVPYKYTIGTWKNCFACVIKQIEYGCIWNV